MSSASSYPVRHHGTTPLWLSGSRPTPAAPLDGDLTVDTVVVGGGIAGITTALLLQREGLSVAVLERDTVAGGATGYTTAKVSALQQTKYEQIRKIHGEAGAAAYARASIAAVDRIAGLVAEGIDCGWERLPAFTYAPDGRRVPAIEAEARAARDAGLPVELTSDVPVPFSAPMAVRLDDQAQFDPVRYVRGLAARFVADGGQLFEASPVVNVHERSPCRVETAAGHTVTADDIVICTNYPLLDRGLFFARTETTRSYLIAARLSEPAAPAMLISAGTPTRSLRPYTDPDGGHWILVGGEGHTTGADDATPERYALLEDFARAHFDVQEIPYRWSTQDAMPLDKLPYIGSYTPLSRHLYVNAGGQKWGMTNGTFGAMLLADQLAGRDNPLAGTFSPNRLSVRAAPSVAKDTAQVGAHFVGDRIRSADTDSSDDVPAGDARSVRDGLGKTGVYRDEAGALHAVSMRCTHLGCLVHFNHAERSWDCPCHGSRFGVDGGVLAGPATRPLERRDPPR